MYPLKSLSPRPTFVRQPSDAGMSERAQAALRAPSPAFSDVSTDAFLPTAEAQGTPRPQLHARLAEHSKEAAKQALPYWREGLVFAAFVGVTTWLAVLTHKLRDLQLLPYCDELSGR